MPTSRASRRAWPTENCEHSLIERRISRDQTCGNPKVQSIKPKEIRTAKGHRRCLNKKLWSVLSFWTRAREPKSHRLDSDVTKTTAPPPAGICGYATLWSMDKWQRRKGFKSDWLGIWVPPRDKWSSLRSPTPSRTEMKPLKFSEMWASQLIMI